jgi:hypothetical protein
MNEIDRMEQKPFQKQGGFRKALRVGEVKMLKRR